LTGAEAFGLVVSAILVVYLLYAIFRGERL
jgi:K+-transporting ATPase KdpF subunit